MRPGIDNAMPRLAKALARVDTALGPEANACRAIALGVHGTRVIDLAPLADEFLMDEAATEVRTLAALLAMHLEHFPDWISYRTPQATPPSEAEMNGARPVLDQFKTELEKAEAVDNRIPAILTDLAEAEAEAPHDTLSRRAYLDSARNVLASLSRWVLSETKDIVSGGWEAAKKGVKIGVGTFAGAGLIGLFEALTGTLASLATTSPGTFGWLLPVLRWFGLG
jgi:hypothetical protein